MPLPPLPEQIADHQQGRVRRFGTPATNGRADGGRDGRRTPATPGHRATPSPYPIAPVIPATSPWNGPGRGTSEGVNDRHTNTTATHAPGRVYRNRRRAGRSVGRLSTGAASVVCPPGGGSVAGSWTSAEPDGVTMLIVHLASAARLSHCSRPMSRICPQRASGDGSWPRYAAVTGSGVPVVFGPVGLWGEQFVPDGLALFQDPLDAAELVLRGREVEDGGDEAGQVRAVIMGKGPVAVGI